MERQIFEFILRNSKQSWFFEFILYSLKYSRFFMFIEHSFNLILSVCTKNYQLKWMKSITFRHVFNGNFTVNVNQNFKFYSQNSQLINAHAHLQVDVSQKVRILCKMNSKIHWKWLFHSVRKSSKYFQDRYAQLQLIFDSFGTSIYFRNDIDPKLIFCQPFTSSV